MISLDQPLKNGQMVENDRQINRLVSYGMSVTKKARMS
jgi:hypothetical protein